MSSQAYKQTSEICVLSTAQDDIILEYVAGHLSPAKHAIMSCAVELNEDLAESVSLQTAMASVFLDEVRAEPLSQHFMDEAFDKISFCPSKFPANDMLTVDENIMQTSIHTFIDKAGLDAIQWKPLIPGVAVHDILGNRKMKDGDRLYLLKAKGGMCIPEHSHRGEEWSLILTGGYQVDGKTYRRGDLHIEDETTGAHSPEIAEGEDCICLVMIEGPLIMKRWIPKLVQRIVGI